MMSLKSGAIAIAGALFILLLVSPNTFLVAYERISFQLAPSAERAFSYGSRHLDRAHASFYSIDDAEYFYRLTAGLDPTYPYVHHQLARISFLRKNYLLALVDINKEIELYGEKEANTYYVRALIHGFRGDYASAAADYETYLETDPGNWAAINDYAWVLLKDKRYTKAREAVREGLTYFPDNAWLLNSLSIAEYELGNTKEALRAAEAAAAALTVIDEDAWSMAYPGNDPRMAGEGLSVFKTAVQNNVNSIRAVLSDKTIE